MAIDRRPKLEQELQHHIATFVQQESNADPLITITRIVLSPDLTQATVYFTTIPDGKETHAEIFLKRSGTELRHYIKQHVRLRKLPHLDFVVDAGERHRQHIDELVRETGTPSSEVNKNEPK